jgi:L-fucose isomerase-like protein
LCSGESKMGDSNRVGPNLWVGDFPKIGIRPAIDGRRNGVRESLEDQTMNMAKAVADLLTQNLRYPNGEPVQVVIADSTIGGVKEAAMAAEKFRREGVGVSLTVTPCWCYGSETMDMDPHMPKAVWGFNGTERPGAVYLAAVLAAHNQKGLPAFSIYGHDVQDSDDTSIPEDVQEKLLRFARAGLAVALMRGKSYLSLGGVSMGIAGSIVDQDLFEAYLGMRVEVVDMTEFTRRIDEGIYDPEEYEKALAWTKEYCTEGREYNAPEMQRSREQKDQDWETVVKMAMIGRDLMVGNPRLEAIGYGEEAMGHNALLGGFQGQRQWTDHFPNGDFMEAILNSSFDWNGIRQPFVFATENDALNGISMLLGHLLTNTAQIFADVRTYWSPAAVKRVTGYSLDGLAENGIIHLINSGAATLDATGELKAGWRTGHEAFLGDQRRRGGQLPVSYNLVPGQYRLLPGGRLFLRLPDARHHAGYDEPPERGQGIGACAAAGGRLHRRSPAGCARPAQRAHGSHLADALVRPAPDRFWPVPGRILGDGQLGRQPWRHQLRPHRRGPDLAGIPAAHPGDDAQCARRAAVPPECVERVWRSGPDGRRLPGLHQFRAAVR